VGDSVKSLAEVKVENIHCSPLIYPASHATIEGYQMAQASFPLGEFMLTTPHNLFFLHLLREDIQSELFHHLSRDGDETDWPVDPRVLLLALYEDWSDFSAYTVSRPSLFLLLPISCTLDHNWPSGYLILHDVMQSNKSWEKEGGKGDFI